jgi:hypothetical protein
MNLSLDKPVYEYKPKTIETRKGTDVKDNTIYYADPVGYSFEEILEISD